MKHLDRRDKPLFSFVAKQLFSYAQRFQLPLRQVKPMKRRNAKRYYGQCSARGTIRITLRRRGKRILPYQIVDTMAHELAHLRHWKHRKEWFGLHTRILSLMDMDGLLDRVRGMCDK